MKGAEAVSKKSKFFDTIQVSEFQIFAALTSVLIHNIVQFVNQAGTFGEITLIRKTFLIHSLNAQNVQPEKQTENTNPSCENC